MIFVTVGNSNIGFERLIKAMDALAPKLPYEVIMQIGSSSYIPINTKWFRYSDHETMLKHFKNAKVIITHAGAGTILDILMLGKKPIVVPRLKKFGENIDDHQLEITKILARENIIIPVYDIGYLPEALFYTLETQIKSNKKIHIQNRISQLIRILLEYLTEYGGVRDEMAQGTK